MSIIPISLLLLIIIGNVSIALSFRGLKLSDSFAMQNITVDGTINEAEWSDADWKVPFYLDIDEVFNPPNKDGYIYLYLGEDMKNLN